MPRRHWSVILAYAIAIVGSGGCAARRATPTAPLKSAVTATDGRHTHENLNALLWMQTAVEYEGTVRQAYRTASEQLTRALADTSWSAAFEQGPGASALPPAVVLDLDETVIDNSGFAARRLFDASAPFEAAWAAWCKEDREGAVPGAIAFLTDAHARGVTVFYVTNRTSDVEAVTRATLARLGAPLDPAQDTVLTKNEHGWTDDKAERRRIVAARYRILLLVGDDLGDFTSGAGTTVAARRDLARHVEERWGRTWIVLPNPTYGSWERALVAGQPDLSLLEAKWRAIDPKR
jgi:acid phosphatase